MATTIKYSKTSPYFNTDTFSNFLDVRRDRPIPSDPSDLLYSIDTVYTNRPDLLASDLYGDPALWWVFAERNPNVIQDPIWDFTQGTIIYIPKKENVVAALGL